MAVSPWNCNHCTRGARACSAVAVVLPESHPYLVMEPWVNRTKRYIVVSVSTHTCACTHAHTHTHTHTHAQHTLTHMHAHIHNSNIIVVGLIPLI